MARGDLVQLKRENKSGTTHTVTFSSTPTSGNLLLVAFTSANASSDITSRPSGWTILRETSSGDFAYALYYKVSDGTETTATVVWDQGGGGRAKFEEIEMDFTLVDVSLAFDESNMSTEVTAQGTGSVTPDNGTDNIVVSVVTLDAEKNWDGTEDGDGWTNATAYDVDSTNYSAASSFSGFQINLSGSQSDTYTTNDTGDAAAGLIIAFSPATAVGTPPPQLYINQAVNRAAIF